MCTTVRKYKGKKLNSNYYNLENNYLLAVNVKNKRMDLVQKKKKKKMNGL